eukprot:scaffold31210_cov110-Isochrysis_galbana.AAC.4
MLNSAANLPAATGGCDPVRAAHRRFLKALMTFPPLVFGSPALGLPGALLFLPPPLPPPGRPPSAGPSPGAVPSRAVSARLVSRVGSAAEGSSGQGCFGYRARASVRTCGWG